MKALFIEKRGMNITERDTALYNYTDLDNYRYYARIVDRYGRDLHLEITRGYERRFTSKTTGKPLKKSVIEHEHKLIIRTQYDNMNGSWGDIALDKEISDQPLTYTETDLLKAVNQLSKGEYDTVVICDELPDLWGSVATIKKDSYLTRIVSLSTLQRVGGYRENDIIDHLATFKKEENGRIIELIAYNCGIVFTALWDTELKAYVG